MIMVDPKDYHGRFERAKLGEDMKLASVLVGCWSMGCCGPRVSQTGAAEVSSHCDDL